MLNSTPTPDPDPLADMPTSPWIGRAMRRLLRGRKIRYLDECHYLKSILRRLDHVATKAEQNHGQFIHDHDRDEAEALVWAVQRLIPVLEDEYGDKEVAQPASGKTAEVV